jgi:hypothetical protein
MRYATFPDLKTFLYAIRSAVPHQDVGAVLEAPHDVSGPRFVVDPIVCFDGK